MICSASARLLILGLLAATPLAAQQPDAKRPGSEQPAPSRRDSRRSRPRPSTVQGAWTEISSYSEERSRAAFHACDRDADDRLSVFEAGRALRSFGSVEDRDAFLRVDANTDGYIEWPEFDRRFREILNSGGNLQLRPYRPKMLAPPQKAAEAAGPTKATRLHDLLDRDDDGKVSADEFQKFAVALGVVAGQETNTITALDTDQSKTLEPKELSPLAEKLPERLLGPTPTGDAKSRLPPGYRAADRNRDGVLDAAELRRALQRIDPVLGRWTEVILRNADISKNGALGRLEIESAQRQGASDPDAKRRAPKPKK